MKVTFEIDKQSLKEMQDVLKKAGELPRKNITKVVKTSMKLPLDKAKEILKNLPRDYTMKFEDGNTWTKQDIIDNLYLQLEKSYSKDKKVYRLAIKDPNVDYYANFVEFGYFEDRDIMQRHFPSEFMRRSLDETAPDLAEEMIDGFIKSLKGLGLLE